MSELNAILLVIGLMAVFLVPVYYWISLRDGNHPIEPPSSEPESIPALSAEDILHIEKALDVKLPESYATFLQTPRTDELIDEITVIADADDIIGATLEYRRGMYKLPPWPESYVCIGDESDACPYILDCDTGRFFQSHKGNLSVPTISEYPNFETFIRERQKEIRDDLETEAILANEPETWRDKLRDCIPYAVAFFLFFVVLPIFGFILKQLVEWIFGVEL